MAFGVHIWFALAILLLIAKGEPQVPCYFIFGDSLVDNGNNNNLSTQAKANYPPYGIDFPDGPTGRFTNGRNIADFLAELLGFNNSIPPFAAANTAATTDEMMKGVNYASGSAGIREETGSHLGDRICLDRQLQNHNATVSRIGQHMQNLSLAKENLSKCLYSVGMGSNDYLINFLMPQNFQASRLYTPERFASVLIKKYSTQLTTLYGMGARKVAVFGVGEIGCVPGVMEKYDKNASLSCVDSVNAAVEKFNDMLKPLIDKLNKNLPDAKFIFINMTSISGGDPSALGISNINEPCCKVSTTKLKGQCEPEGEACSNREAFMFWDNYHPSQASSMAIAKRSYIASLPSDVYPMDINTLVQHGLQKM